MSLGNTPLKNILAIEILPITALKIGDEVLIIWVAEKEIWTVLDFCNDGYVDIRSKTSNAAMSIPFTDIRLASLLLDKFKTGDLVVCTVASYLPIFKLKKRSYPDPGDDFVISHESDKFGIEAFSVEYPYSDIRHATLTEKTAGRRCCE